MKKITGILKRIAKFLRRISVEFAVFAVVIIVPDIIFARELYANYAGRVVGLLVAVFIAAAVSHLIRYVLYKRKRRAR